MLKTTLALLLALLARPAAAMEVSGLNQISIVTGGSAFNGGTITGDLTLAPTAQLRAGNDPLSVYPSSGPLMTFGRDALGILAQFFGTPGSQGSFIVIRTTSTGAGAGFVGIAVTSGTSLNDTLATMGYDGSTGDVSFGGTSSHGEVVLNQNGSVRLDPRAGSSAIIGVSGAGNVTLTSTSGNVTASAGSGDVSLTSTSGNINMTATGGDLNASVTAGRFVITGAGVASDAALCINAARQLSACSSAVGAGGGCTCP